MMEKQPERIDSNVIRQGLLSIRNSQIDLLNELKNQTQQLKKTPVRLNTSTEDSRSDQTHKADALFSFPPENAESIVRYTPPSPSTVEKPFSFGLANDRQLQSELAHLRDENKMLNQTLQKLTYSRSLDKERVRELESYLYFSSKMYYQILSQILSGTSVPETRRAFENDLRINEDIYGKYQENNHGLLLELLKEREHGSQPFRVASAANITTPSRKEAEITSELEGLKEQLVMLLKTNHKSENNSTFELQNGRLKEERIGMARRCEEMQQSIVRLDSDNKELALCWQRQINERKGVIAELERVNRERGASNEMQKQFSFAQTDLQSQLNRAHSTIREKEATDLNKNDKLRQLSDVVTSLKEENQGIKREMKSIEQVKSSIQQENLEASRSRENEMVMRMGQQGSMLGHYEKQNFQLKGHLAELRQRFEVMAQVQAHQRQNDMANQQFQNRKMQAIKTNSTVEHLWQVKRVQYENINELMAELKEKNMRN